MDWINWFVAAPLIMQYMMSVIAALFVMFLFTFVGFMVRGRKIKRLSNELNGDSVYVDELKKELSEAKEFIKVFVPEERALDVLATLAGRLRDACRHDKGAGSFVYENPLMAIDELDKEKDELDKAKDEIDKKKKRINADDVEFRHATDLADKYLKIPRLPSYAHYLSEDTKARSG